ncbi:growth arrest-specific protein 1-like [Centruroides vittatus]|uniref:growth arrest-specific protein 1-like n=1 Tax=Centruroides vittatus TaxID=120091 RepID=UPI00351044D8
MNCIFGNALLFLSSLCVGMSTTEPEQCEIARMKCAYRVGCGMALRSYMIDCAEVMAGRSKRCPAPCKRALVALMSTEEGQVLVDCDCHNSEFCEQSKERIEVCRPEVMSAMAEDSVVSCSVAQWICAADPLCSTALDYYHRLCRSMFHGRKCTPRCNNSLAILNRQDKATKLRTCYCDGSEDFACHEVKRNTNYLCYGKITAKEENELSSACYLGYKLLFWTCIVWNIIFTKPWR